MTKVIISKENVEMVILLTQNQLIDFELSVQVAAQLDNDLIFDNLILRNIRNWEITKLMADD